MGMNDHVAEPFRSVLNSFEATEWRCSYCGKLFATKQDRNRHEDLECEPTKVREFDYSLIEHPCDEFKE